MKQFLKSKQKTSHNTVGLTCCTNRSSEVNGVQKTLCSRVHTGVLRHLQAVVKQLLRDFNDLQRNTEFWDG